MRNREPDRIAVLDVRELGEVANGVIENSLSIPLGGLGSRLTEVDREKLLVVDCKGGYRSSIATSILRRAGFRDIANLTGRFDAWRRLALLTSSPYRVDQDDSCRQCVPVILLPVLPGKPG